MIYSKGYCDSCDTDNCEHANPLRLGRVDQTPQQAAIVKALDERATLLARVAELEAIRDAHADCYECDEDAAMCDCSWHENARRARETRRDQPDDIIRAAEGVTLEPGLYQDVDSGARMNIADMWPAKKTHAGWCFMALTGTGTSITAVRRVAPESAAKPPAELYVPKPGERVRMVEVCPGDKEPKHGVGDTVTVLPFVSAARESSTFPGWLLLNDETFCRVVPAPLTATEAKLETWKSDAQHFKAERDKSDKMVDDANAELARLKAEACDPAAQPLRDKALEDLQAGLARVMGELAAEREHLEYGCAEAFVHLQWLERQRADMALAQFEWLRAHERYMAAHPTDTPAVAAPVVTRQELDLGQIAHTWSADEHGNEILGTEWGLFCGRSRIEAERLALAARPTAIPRGTTLEVGRWYRITDISANDTGPKHKVGDIVKCDDHSDTGIRRRFADENWFAAALHGGTYVTGLELVPGPDAKKEGA